MKRSSEVVKLRIDKKIMQMIRERAKEENRTLSGQIEHMIMEKETVINAKQPFIMALFPQGANEEEINNILKNITTLQVANTIQTQIF